MPDVTDTLQELLDAQEDLQVKSYGGSPALLLDPATAGDAPEAVDFVHWNVTAATDELHELLGEVGWKPWATSRHVNVEAARGEWVDAFHFMLNLATVLHMDAADIRRRYLAKRLKNAARQEAGYDGVAGKCPFCHRALDDDAVTCGPHDGGPLWYCMDKGPVAL